MSGVGSNAGLHTYRMHFMAGLTNVHMLCHGYGLSFACQLVEKTAQIF